MKILIAFLLTGASLLSYSCTGTDSVPGCQTADSYCRNYTGYGWYQDPYTMSDLRDHCGSGTFYAGGCPENNAYAVCHEDDSYEGFNFGYVFYIESLSVGMASFSEDECEILNNN